MQPLNVFVHLNILSVRRIATGILLACTLTGCGTVLPSFSGGDYVAPVGGAAPMINSTQYTTALQCLGGYLQTQRIPLNRFTVGRVEDLTGKQDLVNGKRVTQGASLMVITALSQASVPMVERLELAIGEVELKYTDLKLIGDNNQMRLTYGGSVVGSDYFIVGGITEVNYNVRSGAFDSMIRYTGLSGRYAVLDLGLDLRMVNTRTLEVVKVSSLRKQIIGTEVRTGFFRFFNDTTIDISASDISQEPIQRGIRMLSEMAVFEMLKAVYAVPQGICEEHLSNPKVAQAATSPSLENSLKLSRQLGANILTETGY